jgi:hypothetical protein
MKEIKETKRNPGSDEAVKLGCLCPRMDNNYGKANFNFVINMNCPIHTAEMTLDKDGLHII